MNIKARTLLTGRRLTGFNNKGGEREPRLCINKRNKVRETEAERFFIFYSFNSGLVC
jgi:hypothetical protein